MVLLSVETMAVQPWPSDFTFLDLSFFKYKVRDCTDPSKFLFRSGSAFYQNVMRGKAALFACPSCLSVPWGRGFRGHVTSYCVTVKQVLYIRPFENL